MRLRSLKNKDEYLNNCEYLIKDPNSKKGKWISEFNNSNPIHLEIGMGKGDFIYNMAIKYPDINFIGIEKYTKVIARAIKKHPDSLPNLRIINMDALNLKDVFDSEIDTIYLNFSDPWPKSRNENRRLTSEVFLNLYDYISKPTKHICLKTDNKGFYGYSIVSLSAHGYIINNACLDLEHSDIPNVLTEYETKFINAGDPIYYLEAKKD